MSQPPSTDRGASSTVGTILMVATALIAATTLGLAAFGIADELDQPAPEVAVDAEFEVREPLDPHWIFEITHKAGDTVSAGELRIRLVDNFGNRAERVYPRQFDAGDTIRVGLWGSPGRAGKSGVDCTARPRSASGAGNDQLVGGNPVATTVRVAVVHEPSESVMDRVTVDLGDFPRRFGTRLIDGSKPSIGCNDVQWRSGTVVPYPAE